MTELNNYAVYCLPLTTSILSPDALWDAEDEQFAWINRAWTGEPPQPSNLSAEDSRLKAEVYRLCGNPAYRIELLRGMYETLGVSGVKVRAAYILGHHSLVQAEEVKEGGGESVEGEARE